MGCMRTWNSNIQKKPMTADKQGNVSNQMLGDDHTTQLIHIMEYIKRRRPRSWNYSNNIMPLQRLMQTHGWRTSVVLHTGRSSDVMLCGITAAAPREILSYYEGWSGSQSPLTHTYTRVEQYVTFFPLLLVSWRSSLLKFCIQHKDRHRKKYKPVHSGTRFQQFLSS